MRRHTELSHAEYVIHGPSVTNEPVERPGRARSDSRVPDCTPPYGSILNWLGQDYSEVMRMLYAERKCPTMPLAEATSLLGIAIVGGGGGSINEN
jgi:hypothetical protein